MYRFYRYRGAKPWALVTHADRALPKGLDAEDWNVTLDREVNDTNPDVRRLVDEHGHCLIESECTFEQLAREIEAAGGSIASAADGDLERTEGEYRFYIHRTLPAWRLALARDGAPVPALRIPDWRFSRSRTADHTAAPVRAEIAQRGYCLFKISPTLP